MTAEIELLPLVGILGAMPQHHQEDVHSYTYANVAHHTAKLQAEIEALRAEAERLRLLAGNQHQLMQHHGVPLPEGYSLPAAAETLMDEFAARRERTESLAGALKRAEYYLSRQDVTPTSWDAADYMTEMHDTLAHMRSLLRNQERVREQDD